MEPHGNAVASAGIVGQIGSLQRVYVASHQDGVDGHEACLVVGVGDDTYLDEARRGGGIHPHPERELQGVDRIDGIINRRQDGDNPVGMGACGEGDIVIEEVVTGVRTCRPGRPGADVAEVVLTSIVETAIAWHFIHRGGAGACGQAFETLKVRQRGDGTAIGTSSVADRIAGVASTADGTHGEGVFGVGRETVGYVGGVVDDNGDRVVGDFPLSLEVARSPLKDDGVASSIS